ncbi:exonuclease V [Trichoderma asperellum]|uniref:Exonuclease V n=1 Tax=Trichoderma asperellum TaxID=101201 RepID=A0A6V8QZS7_TRIAP|nr:exonuclease V [Trichoderma asperellum]
MNAAAIQTSDDEFGYDFETDDEELLIQLATNASLPPKQTTDAVALITAASTAKQTVAGLKASQHVKSFHEREGSRDAPALSPGNKGKAPEVPVWDTDQKRAVSSASSAHDPVAYPDLTTALEAIQSVQSPPPTEVSNDDEAKSEDDRSPLQRFRSFPRKPLTVTDLTAGAWCELQYWYTLTQLPGGRRTRTPAMKQGSKVHKKLEDEVHTTVKIEIVQKEDGFGLRLWNLVQGLRTLRDTGLTRELEVWGLVDGNLVNGVIDDLSYDNPNPEFEKELSSQVLQPSEGQSMISDYFPPPQSNSAAKSSHRKIFLTDVKTRGTLSPISPAIVRPAKIQLLLYHRFLSNMADGKLDFFKVLRRYGLNADVRFSDTFMSQIGELHDEIFFDTPTSSAEEYMEVLRNSSTQDDTNTTALEPDSTPGAPDLLKYGTLRELLTLVKDELRFTFPRGADSLGRILCVKYVYREDGRELNTHDFPVSPQTLDAYLAGDMSWWRGDREPRGVKIEEAFKCSTCEFAAGCSWRQGMDQERVKRTLDRVNKAKKAVETRF